MTFRRRHLLLLFLIPIIILDVWLVRSSSPQSPPQSFKNDLPQLELELKHPNLILNNTKANSQAVKLLFSSLGYEQVWHFFYLPQPEYHNQALFPQRLLFTVLPVDEYQPLTHGSLIAPIKYQDRLTSGFNCQPNPDQTLVHCHLFLNELFFSNPEPSQTNKMLVYDIFRILFIISNQEIDSDQYPQTLESLLEQLEQKNLKLFEFSSLSSNASQSAQDDWLKTLLSRLQSQVFAYGNDYCEGYLECKVKEYYCRCLNGQICEKNSYDCPGSEQCTNCSFWDCTGLWEQVDHLFCSTFSWPVCPNPMGGTCEQRNSSTYCQTGGTCYPAGGSVPPPPPTATPPPAPGCSGACCAAGQICNGEIVGGVCPEGYTCCNSCSTENGGDPWPAYGVYRVWLFHDLDESTTFNSADEQLPPDVLANTTVVAQTTGGGYRSNPANSALSGVWSIFENDGCPFPDPNLDCGERNSVCCFNTDACFGHCIGAGTCGDPKKAICGNWLQATFFSSFLWNYYNPDKFNSFDIDFAIGPEGNYVYYTTGIQFTINPPEGWKVTTLRHRSARPEDDSPLKTYTTGTNIISGTIRSRNAAADRLKNQTSLLAVGLTEINNPPVVLQSQISAINGESVAPVDNTYQICHPSSATTRLNLLSVYSDEDEIYHGENRVENGGFEAGLEGWGTSGTGMGTVEISSDSHIGDNALLVQSTWVFGGDSGQRRAIQWVDLNPNTNYSLTASYKDGGPNAKFSIHFWCNGGGTDYPAAWGAFNINFSDYHPTYQTISYSFNLPSCDPGYSLQAAIFTDATNGAYILLDGILLRENSLSAGPYSDLRNIQLNLENNPYSNPGDPFSNNNWPLRVMLNRNTNGTTPQDHFKIQYQPNMNNASSLMQFQNNIWYLNEDIAITNPSGQTIATLISSNLNTYFSIPSFNTRAIEAKWVVDLHSNFPAGQYYLTSFVRDFRGNQDNRDYSAFSNRSNLTLDYEGSLIYFHRFSQVNVFSPNLEINFVEWTDEDEPSGGFCPYRVNDDPVTLSSGQIEIKAQGSPESEFVSTNINSQSSITINAPTCADSYDIRLTLNQADGYACNCQATGGSNLECYYSDVPASYLEGNHPINFYLTSIDFTNEAWFQAIGGQIVAQGNINSNIPFNDATGPCISGNNCLPGLITHQPWIIGSINENTPGFPLSSHGSINTHGIIGGVTLIHIDNQRTQSVDGHAIDSSTIPNQYGYDFFYNKFGIDYASDLGNHLSNSDQPTLSPGLNIRFAPEGETFEINSPWQIESGQQLIVFVDGNLLISDTVGESRVIRTDLGGYLAFIVSGNVIFDESVGYNNPGGIPVAFSLPNTTLPNVEGIFIADGQLSINSDSNPATSDKKFIGAGTFVGWSEVNLNRSFDDGVFGNAWHNYNPTETFIYRPDFLLNTPMVMKQSIHEWREAPPKSIN